ncbi:MFS transporter [Algibacillus agarilyticus]|uniref:MFS transporter n=1 Tax=Algibacillus agarilyticus TaxID=2234133 RepID=UPI000DCFA778|nr:MFS transporter [Algibacillus agarilyticus]
MTDKSTSLLFSPRFLPYFITQALGAFNDNLYKNTLLLLVAFMSAANLPMSSDLIINLAAGLFILPFFLFSAHAGLLADKLEKSAFIQKVKLCEVILMALAGVAILLQQVSLMLLLLFLMGCQSAYFGPVKYALLPQHLKPGELLQGNALVELGTFLAILLGTLLAGILIGADHGTMLAAGLVFAFAILGYLSARKIPYAAPIAPELSVPFKPLAQAVAIIKLSRLQAPIFSVILAISWFWFMGATYLTQFPNLTKTVLQAQPEVVSILLALFSIGIGLGSLLCSKLSKQIINLNLVPVGVIGLSLFSVHLNWAIPDLSHLGGQLQSASQYLSAGRNFWLMLDILAIGLFGGLYIVPLYAYIQKNAQPALRARMFAANNIMNALFMVGSAIIAIIVLAILNVNIPHFFMGLGIANALIGFVLLRPLTSRSKPQNKIK